MKKYLTEQVEKTVLELEKENKLLFSKQQVNEA